MKRVAAAALVLAAGCGSQPEPAPPPAISVAAGPTGQRCPPLPGRRALPATLPEGLFPAQARVLREDGRSVAVVVPGELITVFNALAAAAPRAGLRVTARDFEQIEAELSLAGAGRLVALQFGPFGGCRNRSLVVATVAPAG